MRKLNLDKVLDVVLKIAVVGTIVTVIVSGSLRLKDLLTTSEETASETMTPIVAFSGDHTETHLKYTPTVGTYVTSSGKVGSGIGYGYTSSTSTVEDFYIVAEGTEDDYYVLTFDEDDYLDWLSLSNTDSFDVTLIAKGNRLYTSEKFYCNDDCQIELEQIDEAAVESYIAAVSEE